MEKRSEGFIYFVSCGFGVISRLVDEFDKGSSELRGLHRLYITNYTL
jgi:hypothetical protein